MLRREPEQGQRDADLVVEVAVGLQDPEALGDHGGGHPARAGLAVGPRDGDHRGAAAVAMERAEVAQGAGRVGHRRAGDPACGPGRFGQRVQVPAVDEQAAHPAAEHIGDEAVAVVDVALDGHEQLAGGDRARVDRYAGEALPAVAAHPLSAGGLQYVLHRPGHSQ